MDMLTPQNFREKTFERAIFGGYDMGSVDDFIEEAANDFSSVARENMVLKTKMKVLVEKIEEYRATEDSMRLTLLSAQKLSTQIEKEAREKADSIITEARLEADRITREAHNQRIEEEAKLIDAKKASAAYIENVRMLTAKQMNCLDNLDKFHRDATRNDTAAVPEIRMPTVEDTVRTIESSVERMAGVADENREIGKVVSDTQDGPATDGDPTRMFGGASPITFGK
jgi:cell division initiation protein